MFNSLLPKGAPFFELLLQQNDMLCTATAKLVEALEDPERADQVQGEIAKLEVEADDLHLSITKHLSQSFITPIDREDILCINKNQEEAVDLAHNVSKRLVIFEFDEIRFSIRKLSQNIHAMTLLTRSMLEGLAKKRDSHQTKAFRSLRNECDLLISMGLAELMDVSAPTPQGVLEMYKWAKTYDRMEFLLNEVVELAEAIEEAVLKNV